MGTIELGGILQQISIWAVPVLLAITLHEAAHGFVAWKLGDDTAYRLGRVTANPARHIDPFGTIILPAMLLLASGGRFMFGFAKPVPVNFGRLKPIRLGMILVAAAGPGANIILAFLSALGLHLVGSLPGWLAPWAQEALIASIHLNAVLAVFNMIPIPPLDGGRVAVGLLPRRPAMALARLERWGIFIILGAMILLPELGRAMGVALDPFRWFMAPAVDAVINLVAAMAGIG